MATYNITLNAGPCAIHGIKNTKTIKKFRTTEVPGTTALHVARGDFVSARGWSLHATMSGDVRLRTKRTSEICSRVQNAYVKVLNRVLSRSFRPPGTGPESAKTSDCLE